MEQLRVWIEDAAPTTVAGAQRAMAGRADSTPLLGDIRVPTLVIVGEEDPTTPPSEAAAIAQAVHGARLVQIPGAGHFSNMEQPDAFNAAVREFMHQFRP
jgi:pimeloyl-ACP methyl ester carboxylesterase